ncbi:MAG TPA: ATP-binding protein [Actinomycetota bacterium]|nr:ATP-binding protein [Actinomycetota bacterium]
MTEPVVIRLDPTPRAVKLARDALDRFRGRLPDRTIEDARLLISELVTNSVRHASLPPDQPIEVKLGLDGRRLRVEVVDQGPGFPSRPRTEGPPSGFGRGLFLVDRIATAWGTRTDGATHVWFELEPSDTTASTS